MSSFVCFIKIVCIFFYGHEDFPSDTHKYFHIIFNIVLYSQPHSHRGSIHFNVTDLTGKITVFFTCELNSHPQMETEANVSTQAEHTTKRVPYRAA